MSTVRNDRVYAEALHTISKLKPGDLVAYDWRGGLLRVKSVEPTEAGLVHVQYENGFGEVTDPELVVHVLVAL